MNGTNIACLVLVLAPLAGACESTSSIPEIPVGAKGMTDKRVFDDEGNLVDPRGDSDGDGIPDREELVGWTVTVDANGFAVGSVGVDSAGNPVKEALEVREVTSDPRFADTDGDGLDDGAERMIKSDPRRTDTDGDTLSDLDEATRWATSPVSADTDGDARGADPTNPRPPNFALFDAAELRLMRDPRDPGGPLIPGPGATSPWMSDTDGDGVSDYHELLGGMRRATVAEIPKFKLLATPGASLDMYLNVVRSDGTRDSRTYGTTTSFAEEGHVSSRLATSFTFFHSDYVGAFVRTKETAGCCLNIVKSETEIGARIETETRMEQTVSFDMEIGASFESSHAVTEASAREESSEITIASGTIRVPLDVMNAGPVPFRMTDLVIGIRRFDRYTRQVVPVTEIRVDDLTLGVGERRTIDVSSAEVPVQAMQALMADPGSLQFVASRFSLRDQYGVDFDFRLAEVRENTAVIAIDYGEYAQRFHVAANVDIANGVTVGQALTQLGIPFEAKPVDFDDEGAIEGFAVKINGLGTELHEGPPPDLGDRLPYPEGYEPGPRLVKRGWFGAIRPFDGSAEEGPYYANLFEVPLLAGDEVVLVYTEDLDRDGVPAVEEARWGSSDLNPHSDGQLDGDGLSDYWETRVGWLVETAGRAPYRVFSSPVARDTDSDGLADDLEAGVPTTDFGTGSDPWLVDTDADGLGDRFEYDDTAYGLDPNVPVDMASLPRPSVSCRIVANDRAGGIGPQTYRVEASATDGESDLVSLAVRYAEDGAVMRADSAPTDRLAFEETLLRCHVDTNQIFATATDALGLTSTTTCAFAVTPPQGDPCNGVDDDCDGVVDDGCPTIGGALTVEAITANLPWVADDEGGAPGSLDCGDRMIRKLKVYHGSLVDKLGAYCTTPKLGQPYLPDGRSEYVYPVSMEGDDPLLVELGGNGANNNSSFLNCADVGGATAMMGFFGGAGDEVDRLGAMCSSMIVERVDGVWRLTNWWTGNVGPYGGGGGDAFGRECAVGTMPHKLNLRTGSVVDNLSVECARFRVPQTPTITP